MHNLTHGCAHGLPVSDSDRNHAMRLGISFNGKKFAYRDFRYDRLEDAVSYAELDAGREGGQPAVTLANWLDRPIPNVADQAVMKLHGISFEDGRYRYLDYRYDRLADAANFAHSQEA